MTEHERIFIVDDNLDGAQAVKFLLEWKGGHQVALLESGDELLRRLDDERPSLILLDIHMPGLDGFETCARLKSDEATRDIPVIFVTSRNDPDAVVQGLELGADDYICKPYEPAELLARVNVMLRIRELQAQLVDQERLQVLLETAGAAAHELNQPLTVLQGNLELLERQLPPDHGADQRIDRMKDATKMLTEIVRRMAEVRSYRTRQYVGNMRILDLTESTR